MGHLFPVVDTELQARLRILLSERGMSMRELSLAAGLNETAVKAILAGKSESPRGKTITALARVLDVPASFLLTGVKEHEGRDLPRSNVRIPDNSPEVLNFQTLPRDIPVMGTAQGGPEGAFLLNMTDGPIDWARRPPGLTGLNAVFAIYCEGDSMSPWREPGSLIYVHKSRPPHIGAHVVVVVESNEPGQPPAAYVKKLVRRTAERIELEQYNPPRQICLPTGRVREILRVIEWEEVLGV